MKNMFRLHRAGVLGFIVLLAVAPAFVSLAADETLNNAAIVELQKMNLGDGVIIEKIKTSKCDFDTSLSGLKQLKEANVSSAVIQTMVASKPATTSVSAPAAAGNVDDPAAPHSAGVWILEVVGGKNKMTKLPSEIPSEISHGGFIGPWGAGKISQTARLTGTQSEAQLSQRKPELYFYFKDGTADFYAAQSPKELVLAQFTVLPKDAKRNANQRALDIASHGAYGGSSGVDAKARREFEVTTVADGIYKVVPQADLADGEYAFCSAMAMGQRFFTFGVHAK